MYRQKRVIDRIHTLSPGREHGVSRLAEELPEKVTVSFHTGDTGILDMKDPRSAHWARIIDERQQANQPVYVEIDEDTGVITDFRVPQAYGVERLDLDDHGNLRVRLRPSHAIHLLLRSDPNFDAMRASLEAALADGSERLITETRDEHEIFDVRQLEAEPAGSYGPAPSVLPDPPVSEARAGEVFNNMNGEACSPFNPTDECIPFMYPDDGCWIRAHIMCHLMRSGGPNLATNPPEDPGKVWIHANTELKAPTANHPDCYVTWGWHVAPTLTIPVPVPLPDPPAGAPPDDPAREKYRVIDPSLSLAPEKEAAWHGRQGDSKARLTDTPWTHYNWVGDNRSFSLEQAHKYMQKYRDELSDRCLDLGPPPYSCTPSCFFIIDRSTFSKNEIEAMLLVSNPAVVETAFYIVMDGFSPYDLGFTAAVMQHTPNLSVSPEVAGLTITPVRLEFEYPTHLNRRQRLTWVYDVSFSNTSAFTNELITVTLQAAMSTVFSAGYLYLTTQPNPYENDGPTSWLSTDLRVFRISTGQSKFGVPMGSDPSGFITEVITNLNSDNAGGQTFETDISTDPQTSRLELSRTVNGTPVYNFAVAKVRYRALVSSATDVRVFFRLFPVATTSLDYNQATTYRRHTAGGSSIPLLGIKNGEVAAIPCFASPRIDSAVTSMTAQTDAPNVQTLPPDPGGTEVVRYFGCWLDINQTQPQFPIQPMPMDGPYAAGRKSIQELIRNEHQCLVSEISFTPAPIPANATPSVSDKLAQRNLAIVESANPGVVSSRRIPQTFEIRPSGREHEHDELMIDWGNLPAGSVAYLYVPGLAVRDILLLAARKYRSHRLVRIDEHTLKMATGGITYLPIPFTDENLPSLLVVDLPEGIARGQAFKIVVRQVTGEVQPIILEHFSARERGLRHIIGSFQITIPVGTKEALLKPALRQLAVLKHIGESIPASNRWSPVFGRYLHALDDRVGALGGNPDAVLPSPEGGVQNGKPFAKEVPYIGTWLVLGPIFDPTHQPGSHFGDVPPVPAPARSSWISTITRINWIPSH